MCGGVGLVMFGGVVLRDGHDVVVVCRYSHRGKTSILNLPKSTVNVCSHRLYL